MKSTKRILSAILSVVMILGCLTVGFTAQASGADLQEEINAAIAAGTDVDWKGGNVKLADTLVINGDVDVDFNGAVITGPAGKVAVQVKGNVNLFDGVVLADQGSFSGEMAFVKALMNYKPAIAIKGGNVELNCITAVGSLLRIPNSGTIEVPIGNGIATDAGNVVLDNVIAIGMNALDNDNVSSKVTVKDAILVGIYKAVNRSSRVDFGGDNYAQYKTVDVLEGVLKDGVKLSANEKKYIDAATNSEGDISVASVLINVEKPEFTQPDTTFVKDTLNVIADVEPFEHKGVSNRYSYSYTPDYAVIGEDKQEFTADGAQYVASFAGLEAGKNYDVTVNYDLSIKLGKKQKEIVESAFDILAHYIDKAPELLNRFVKDFEDLYIKAESLVGMLYGSIEEMGDTKFNDVLALIYALEGAEYNGFAQDTNERLDTALVTSFSDGGFYSEVKSVYDYASGLNDPTYGSYLAETMMANYGTTDLKEAIYVVTARANAKYMPKNYLFDTDGDDKLDSVFAYRYGDTFELGSGVADEFLAGKPGFGSGKGLLDVFDEYYKDIKALIYDVDENGVIKNEKDFNDLGAAAEYVGANWEGLLELAENAVVVINKAYTIVHSDAFETILGKVNMGNLGSIDSVVKAFDKVYKYANIIINKVDEVKATSFFKTFIADPQKAGDYCKRYTLKAWDIANNPTKYFGEIPVNGDYVTVDLLDKNLNETFTVSTAVKPVNVKVKVSGMGAAKLNSYEAATSYNEWFAYGEDIVIEPVETVAGSSCVYMVVTTNGNMTVVDGSKFTAKAATNLEIDIVFQAEDAVSTNAEIIFMTDKALNYKFLAKIQLPVAEIESKWMYRIGDAVAPDFKGLTKTGWSLNKDGSNAVLDVADKALAKTVAEAAAENDVVVVYANYTYDEQVEVETHSEIIKMVKAEVGKDDGIAYFDISIQLKGAKAIEAGVILTRNAEFATKDAMTIELSGTSGVAFARISSEYYTNGYLNQNLVYTGGAKPSASGNSAVYGRGYVVYEDGTAVYTPIYELAN